jgi:hypothetical protein
LGVKVHSLFLGKLNYWHHLHNMCRDFRWRKVLSGWMCGKATCAYTKIHRCFKSALTTFTDRLQKLQNKSPHSPTISPILPNNPVLIMVLQAHLYHKSSQKNNDNTINRTCNANTGSIYCSCCCCHSFVGAFSKIINIYLCLCGLL